MYSPDLSLYIFDPLTVTVLSIVKASPVFTFLCFADQLGLWQYCVSAKPKPIRKGGFKTKKEAQVAAAEIEDRLRQYKNPS